jgi:hypothetical protein
MKKSLFFLNLFLLIAVYLNGCKGNHTDNLPPESAVFLATGGTGSTGAGGEGGGLNIQSSGAVKILNSGTVDASFLVSESTPSFGTNSFEVISGTTTTLLYNADAAAGNLCTDDYGCIYIGNGDDYCDSSDSLVTGLTVGTGATLVLTNGNLVLSNDLVVDGAIAISDADWGIYIEANLIKVGRDGKISTSGTVANPDAKYIYLGYDTGITKRIINHGSIEAKGIASGGFVYMQAEDLIVNYGTIDVSGGSVETGTGGYCSTGDNGYSLEIYVNYGNFYSSGTVRMNGGNGPSGGGDAGSAWVETAYSGNDRDMNGDIILSGTWEAIGGNGEQDGNGGGRGYLGFQTDAMGKIAVNATMTLKSGFGKGALSSGGNASGVDFYSYNYGSVEVTTPGKIQVAGTLDFRGGDGDLSGGYGGYLYINSEGVNSAGDGVDVEMIGFPFLHLTGGDGAVNGGAGGYAQIQAATVINNSSSLVLSGGEGDTGGSGCWWSGYSVSFEADHVTNTGKLTANGGKGDTTGGDGGHITIMSNDGTASTVNRSDMSVAGGSGATSGANGSISIDAAPIPE